MPDLTSVVLRKKIIPVIAIAVVLAVIAASFNSFVRSDNVTFAFQAYWPPPLDYVPNNPLPSAFLRINYTGIGTQNYTYSIVNSTSILARGDVVVGHSVPFTVYVIAPSARFMEARVIHDGHLVFSQNLTLSG
jgi:hypothetical protein